MKTARPPPAHPDMVELKTTLTTYRIRAVHHAAIHNAGWTIAYQMGVS